MSCPGELLSVVILAGGRGSRLSGQDKGLLEWRGKLFIEHILHNIEPVTKNILINANRNADIYEQYGYPVIKDDMQDYAGPLAGMLAALQSANASYILTVPCDAPSTSAAIIEQFCKAHEEHQQLLYVASTDDGLQPVYAMINVSLADDLQKFLADGKRKTQDWLKKNDAVVVHFGKKSELFMNINTDSEFQAIC